MTTTSKAVGNGSQDIAPAITGQPDRITGMAQVREAETYHAASIMHQVVSEAERLCSAVYRAVTDAYFKDVRKNADNDSHTATETAGSPEIRGQAEEALNCLNAAQRYVQRLLMYEPPF